MAPSAADVSSNKRQKVSNGTAKESKMIDLIGSGGKGYQHFAVMQYENYAIRAWYVLHIESVDIQILSNGKEIQAKKALTPFSPLKCDNLTFTLKDGTVFLNGTMELPIELEIDPEQFQLDLQSGFIIPKFNKEKYQKIPLNTLAETAQTGDICLFSGTSSVSKEIRMATHSAISHVGIIYRDSTGIYLFQSTAGGGQDVLTNTKVQNETMLNKLKPALASNIDNRHYPEAVTYRNLIIQEGTTFEQEEKQRNDALLKFIKSVDGHTYSLSARELLRGLLLNESRSKKGNYFCSELVATSLQLMGYMKKDKVPNAYFPKSYSEAEDADEFKDHLVPGVGYGPELLVTTELTPSG